MNEDGESETRPRTAKEDHLALVVCESWCSKGILPIVFRIILDDETLCKADDFGDRVSWNGSMHCTSQDKDVVSAPKDDRVEIEIENETNWKEKARFHWTRQTR